MQKIKLLSELFLIKCRLENFRNEKLNFLIAGNCYETFNDKLAFLRKEVSGASKIEELNELELDINAIKTQIEIYEKK